MGLTFSTFLNHRMTRGEFDYFGTQRPDNSMRIINGSSNWGLVFGALASFVVAICLTFGWLGHAQSGEKLMLLVLFVPAVTLFGSLFSGFLFGLVGIIVAVSAKWVAPSPWSYAVLASVLTSLSAMASQELYSLLRIVILPVAIVGLFVGRKVAALDQS